MKRILVTMASGTLATGVMRGLRAGDDQTHIIGVDSSEYHIHQSEADESHLVPRVGDPNFIKALVDIATESKADFIWPMHDAEIEAISAVAAEVPIRTWLPPVDVCSAGRDKLATAKILKANGVPVPATMLIETPSDLAQAFDEIGSELWLRSRSGAGAKGAFRAKSIEYATYWLEINDGWGTFIAAEALPGTGDYSWEAIWKNGALIAAQDETRIIRGNVGISLPGVKSRGVLLRSAPKSVTEVGEKAVRALMPEPDGMFRVDMIADEHGVPNVTEVDAGRFGSGGVAYWHHLGYNFAYEALRMAFDQPVGYATPVINPLPADTASVTGLNRDMTFLRMGEVEPLVAELRARLQR